jgi:hypothetical protein
MVCKVTESKPKLDAHTSDGLTLLTDYQRLTERLSVNVAYCMTTKYELSCGYSQSDGVDG